MPKKKSKAKNSVAATHPAAAAVVVSASAGTKINEPYLPGGEDLSLQRHDEETVLSAIYGEDFTTEAGAWNCPLYKLRIRSGSGGAQDMINSSISCELTLSIQLNKKYPHSVPLIHLANTGSETDFQISTIQISELLNLLQLKAMEFASLGQVMGWELGQVVEAYLVGCVEMRRKKEKDEKDGMQRKKNKNSGIKNVKFDDNDDHRGVEDDWLNFDADAFTDIAHDEDNPIANALATPTELDMIMDSDTQREIARQIEALDDAARMREQRKQRGVLHTIADKNDDDDDDGDDGNSDEEEYDYPELAAAIGPAEQQHGGGGNFSRYQTDFVEIAHLGRGGGGEVVQAINRLDRRVYAIKKVLLEEESEATKWATMQNEKLRREVTTISMMAHKNIVRYYQAWVEYPTVIEDKVKEESIPDNEHADSLDATGILDESKNNGEGNNDEEDGDESSSNGWSSSSSSTTSSSSSASLSSTSRTSLSKLAGTSTNKSLSELSLENFLEHEIGVTDFTNPLLGYGALFRYPPTLASPSSKPSSSQEALLPSESYSTSGLKRAQNSGIMYIQMQYCKTTMRDMIDKSKLSIDTVWKSLRQILEALVYIHGRNVIHRDLKPANIFIDDEENIRLGDFGLATSHRPSTKSHGSVPGLEADALYEAIDNISGLIGASSSSSANRGTNTTLSMTSITGGVGTALYMAPEQELSKTIKGKPSYDSKADIFSLGVLLFEMFMLKPIGCTYMERADILTALRGEPRSAVIKGEHSKDVLEPLFSDTGDIIGDMKQHIALRFPEGSSIPLNAQKIILWCLERSPKRRPTAEQLLACDLLPRKVELEETYLNEVMHTLSKSEQSYQQILAKLFDRPNPNAVLTTYDNEISIRANNYDARHLLAQALDSVKGSSAAGRGLAYSRPMSGVALAAAITALRRAQHAGNVSGGGKEGEALRGAPHQAATILAMTAASSAAVEGCAYGLLGADPRVVESICRKLCGIFYSHGAVRLQGPLLRPTDPNETDTSLNKPVDLLARRGSVLRLREDLCIPFARALSRGGSSTNNMKRFDINKVFIESDAGLHPKEMLEASFDIIQDENTAIAELLEAESILVLCQVMSLLAPKEEVPSAALLKAPIWVLKLTHTRLSDAIMDLMFLPTSEAIRQSCLNIFTAVLAFPPNELRNQQRKPGKYKTREMKDKKIEFLDKCIETAVIGDKLPKKSGKRLRAFLCHFLKPQLDANKVLDVISESIKKMHNADMNSSSHSAEVKNLSRNCFGEAMRCINQLRQLLRAMDALGIVAALRLESPQDGLKKKVSYPAYIAIDLGLRQKRKHFSGRLYFQAVLLHDDFFCGNGESSLNLTFDGKGTRIAEGGRYDDLVRQFRPPGNFGSVNEYTVAKVPACIGLILFLGKMIERIYHDAAVDDKRQKHSFVENLRRSMGHPLPSAPINCIVTSESGLDLASCAQRAKICALLWSSGISCEYLAQSGVMLSLLRHLSSNSSTVKEWSSSVDRICGICAILNIPFVIIVQPHLLKTKSVVKVRQTTTHTASGPIYSASEDLVPLSSLSSVLLKRLGSRFDARDDMYLANPPSQPASNGDNLQIQSPDKIEIECIYVGIDQYFDSEHKANNAQWKQVKKVMKTTTQKMAIHISDFYDQSLPVIAIDLPFRAVRDIGSSLIFDGLESLNCGMLQTKYSKHKKLLRNLASALDALIQKDHRPNSEGKRQLTIFLYSISCDKFDMITLACP